MDWIKIWDKNASNLGSADDTTLLAESKGALEEFIMKMEMETEKPGLLLNIKKKLYWSGRWWQSLTVFLGSGKDSVHCARKRDLLRRKQQKIKI